MLSKSVRFSNFQEVVNVVKETGRQLQSAQPLEFAIGNIVRRVLFVLKEEYQLALTATANSGNKPGSVPDSYPTLKNLGSTSNLLQLEIAKPFVNPKDFKDALLSSLNDLIDELMNIHRSIADQAIEHIHANEVIMTYGGSKTVEEFLKSAGKKRKFEVIVAECAPSRRGHTLSISLSKHGIETTLIPDSAVFAMMARVNKVIVGTHAVMANGGLIAPVGTHMVAAAAKYHSVPFVVCTGLYKLTPLYPCEQEAFNDIGSPSEILNYDEADTLENVRVVNPTFDYIPAELVSLYITNIGGHNPSYIYRLLAEYYNPEDYRLETTSTTS